jgi:hypothetical protein
VWRWFDGPRGERIQSVAAFLAILYSLYLFLGWLDDQSTRRLGLLVGKTCHRLDPPLYLTPTSPNPGDQPQLTVGKGSPTYFIEIEIGNTPQVEGLQIRVSHFAAASWIVATNAFTDFDAYAKTLPALKFTPGPDGSTPLPTLPKLAPNGRTIIRGLVFSDEKALCGEEWLHVTHASLAPVLLPEVHQAMSAIEIPSGWLRWWMPALAGFVLLTISQRRHLVAAGSAFLQSRRSGSRVTVPSSRVVAAEVVKPAQLPEPPREFIDLRPKKLVEEAGRHTSAQAAIVLKDFFGKYMRVRVQVSNVHEHHEWIYVLGYDPEDLKSAPSIGGAVIMIRVPQVGCSFAKERWADRVLHLREKDIIDVVGVLKRVDQDSINLEQCEVVPVLDEQVPPQEQPSALEGKKKRVKRRGQ